MIFIYIIQKHLYIFLIFVCFRCSRGGEHFLPDCHECGQICVYTTSGSCPPGNVLLSSSSHYRLYVGRLQHLHGTPVIHSERFGNGDAKPTTAGILYRRMAAGSRQTGLWVVPDVRGVSYSGGNSCHMLRQPRQKALHQWSHARRVRQQHSRTVFPETCCAHAHNSGHCLYAVLGSVQHCVIIFRHDGGESDSVHIVLLSVAGPCAQRH